MFQLHEYKPSSHRIFRLNNIAKALQFLEESSVSAGGQTGTLEVGPRDTPTLCPSPGPCPWHSVTWVRFTDLTPGEDFRLELRRPEPGGVAQFSPL